MNPYYGPVSESPLGKGYVIDGRPIDGSPFTQEADVTQKCIAELGEAVNQLEHKLCRVLCPTPPAVVIGETQKDGGMPVRSPLLQQQIGINQQLQLTLSRLSGIIERIEV